MKKIVLGNGHDVDAWIRAHCPFQVIADRENFVATYEWCCEEFGAPPIPPGCNGYPFEIDTEQVFRWQWWVNPRFRDPNDALHCKLRWG